MIGVSGYEHFLENKKSAFLQSTKPKHQYLNVWHDLVPFVQFKKREKHPWNSPTSGNVADFSLQLC